MPTLFHYTISGLSVASEVELPSAIPAKEMAAAPDIVITEGIVPDTLEGGVAFGELLQIAGGRVRHAYPTTMTVLVEDGRRVTLQRMPDAKQGDVVLLLLGTTFAILLQQRGRVVLHASAVAVNGKAMLFCGASGAGKSTMAALLSRRGLPLLNDDVCNLSRRPDGTYEVFPDGRMLKLWSKSLEHLCVEQEEGLRIRSDAEKYYMAPETVDLTPRVVGGVYVLRPLAPGEPATLETLPLAEAIVELTINAYRPGLVEAMGMRAAYFAASVSITGNSGVFRLSRAMDFTCVDEALNLLEQSWNTTGKEFGA